MTDRIGQQLGNYRLTGFLGEGGFAAVYLGEHIHLHTRAAIKILTTKLMNPEVEQFRHEAYLLAHLSHPNVVRVFDFGIEERERLPFLVMQYASHGTLRQQHARGTCVPLATVLSYIKPAASALQYAHSNRIVHRDVKPENMLIGDQNEVLLSDFGIALLAQTSHMQKTQEFIGTALYMSPEQIQGKPQSASDQYSLGVVVYEWLSGTLPFTGSFLEICSQHVLAPPLPLRQRIPTISQEIEQVMTKVLAKDPKERFPSIQAFAHAFAEAAESKAGNGPYTPSAPFNTVGVKENVIRDSVYVARTPNITAAVESEVRGSVYVARTPNFAAESKADSVFTPTAATGQVPSREERGSTPSVTKERVDPSKSTIKQLQPIRKPKKARNGLIVLAITLFFLLILGSSGTFAALTISSQAHIYATAAAATQSLAATALAQSAEATATTQAAAAAQLISAADFTTETPKMSNMTVVSSDASFDTDHSVLNTGQQVTVTFTLQPDVKSVSLAIRALVSQASTNKAGFAPIEVYCNGQIVVSNYTMPGNGNDINTTSIQIPAQQLTSGSNQLQIVVAANAKTLFWLYKIDVVQSV